MSDLFNKDDENKWRDIISEGDHVRSCQKVINRK